MAQPHAGYHTCLRRQLQRLLGGDSRVPATQLARVHGEPKCVHALGCDQLTMEDGRETRIPNVKIVGSGSQAGELKHSRFGRHDGRDDCATIRTLQRECTYLRAPQLVAGRIGENAHHRAMRPVYDGAMAL